MAYKHLFRSLALFMLILPGLGAMAQLRNANWIFIRSLQFGYGAPQLIPSVGYAGSEASSLSNPQGDLLAFFGNDLRCSDGSLMPVPSSFTNTLQAFTQCGLILPWPGDPTKLAAFQGYTVAGQQASMCSLMVGCVDLTSNGGLGAITSAPTYLDDSLARKLTAVPHTNGQDYWILTQRAASNAFLAYRFRPNGVDPNPVVSYAGAILPDGVGGVAGNYMTHGNLVANYAGDALVSVSFCDLQPVPDTSITELFHFNNATGAVTYWASLASDRSFMGEGGAEFSPDGTKLYVAEFPWPSTSMNLIQYDLTSPLGAAIQNTETFIGDIPASGILHSAVPIAGAPDGRIYIGMGELPQYLAVIEHPDSLGLACGLQPNGVYLSGPPQGFIAMPNFCKRYHDSEMTVGQSEVPALKFALNAWPVPTAELLNVDVPEAGQLAVLDIFGRDVLRQRVSVRGTYALPMTGMAPGTYAVRLFNEKGMIRSFRIVKE